MNLPDATFDVYFASDDDIIECTACDPDAGEPSTWPSWSDAFRFVPTEADVAWLNTSPPPIAGGAPEPFEPTDADWDEMARWSEHVERLDALRRESDAEDEARARFG